MSASPLDNDERFQNTVACTKFMMSMLASGRLAKDKLLSLRYGERILADPPGRERHWLYIMLVVLSVAAFAGVRRHSPARPRQALLDKAVFSK